MYDNNLYSYDNIQQYIMDELHENQRDSIVYYSDYEILNDKYHQETNLKKENDDAR